MKAIGLKTPITVRKSEQGFSLTAGQHRLAAAKSLGWKTIDCLVTTENKVDRQLWRIAENLHRSGLTKLQRAEHIAKWDKLIQELENDAQVAHPGGRQPHDKGTSRAAKKMGISRDDVRRAKKISGTSRKAKTAIKAAGLDNNQEAMIKIANEPTSEAQVEKVHAIEKMKKRAAKKGLSRRERYQFKRLKQAFNRDSKLKGVWVVATATVRRKFINSVLTSLA